jgi:hypothetical protein
MTGSRFSPLIDQNLDDSNPKGVKPIDVDWRSEGDHASGASCPISQARENAFEHSRELEEMLSSGVMAR